MVDGKEFAATTNPPFLLTTMSNSHSITQRYFMKVNADVRRAYILRPRNPVERAGSVAKNLSISKTQWDESDGRGKLLSTLPTSNSGARSPGSSTEIYLRKKKIAEDRIVDGDFSLLGKDLPARLCSG